MKQTKDKLSLSLDPSQSVIITGGTSGLGLRLASWAVRRGAKQLALVSRTGVKFQSDQDLIDQLRTQGVSVRVCQLDVSDPVAIANLFEQIHTELGSIGTIIHSAGVLADNDISQTSEQDLTVCLNSKALGAYNLHQSSLQYASVKHFILISSISSVIALPQQVSYSSANYFLDQLALLRHQAGLPATSLNFDLL